MINDIARNLVKLKKEFLKTVNRKSQMLEIIPKSVSEMFPIDESHLKLLHRFATENPIYHDSFEREIGSVECVVYEGDIDRYWLNSIQHGSSRAPFSPTWIMSGYVCALFAKEQRYSEAIDVGSGDGRIAFCAKILGMRSYSIELDETLVDLQNSLGSITDFHPICSDATTFDYSSLNLCRPVFFIGGLAQMGGVYLATGVLDKIATSNLRENAGVTFVGTLSPKYVPDPKNEAGWGTLIADRGLKTVQRISLPTAWTLHESDDAPYIFTKSANHNAN